MLEVVKPKLKQAVCGHFFLEIKFQQRSEVQTVRKYECLHLSKLWQCLKFAAVSNQAPTLFWILGLEDKVFGVIETLKKKEEYFAAIKFICEFRLSKLAPGALLLESLNSLEKLGAEFQWRRSEAEEIRRRRIRRL